MKQQAIAMGRQIASRGFVDALVAMENMTFKSSNQHFRPSLCVPDNPPGKVCSLEIPIFFPMQVSGNGTTRVITA